uniref:DNA-directed DNA polymerase n=1 Tax=Storeatula sp. CCMP1868 TaxID=195070 RepID=A0A222AHK9_9CRYP|nr:hypothetical protein [Storeatula sp. CCMP1868]
MNHFYIPFHLKYRPQNFDNIIGQATVIQYIKEAIEKKRLTFSYLLIGQHGSGKTTLARIMAKALNCTNRNKRPCNNCINCTNIHFNKSFDVYEIDAAKNTGIETIRDVIDRIQFTPIMNKYKVCIIDEAHMLSNNAFNSLLKTIESPPLNTFFILSTTNVNKIPSTIISRCQKIYLRPIKNQDLALAISKITCNENIKVTNKGLLALLNATKGSFRDALNIIETFSVNNSQLTIKNLNDKYKFPSVTVLHLLIENILINNLMSSLCILHYISLKNWEKEKIATYIYDYIIQDYIGMNKLTINSKGFYFDTKFLIDFLTCLVESNRYINSDSFWFSITSLILKTNITRIKVQDNVKKKALGSYICKKDIIIN